MLVFSSGSFVVSHLTFRSLVHFELIFVNGVRGYSDPHSFICSCPVFPALLIEETVLSPLYILASFVVLWVNRLASVWVYFWSVCSVLCLTMLVPYCFVYCSF